LPDDGDYSGLLRDVDAVVHAAGVAHQTGGDATILAEAFRCGNVELTRSLADAVALSEVHALIHISSIAAAGYTEFSGGDGLSESQQAQPKSDYGKSKREAEQFVENLGEIGKLGVNLRPPLIYGQGARGNWPKLVKLAESSFVLPFGSVSNRRSFLGIENLCDLVIGILEQSQDHQKSGTYHVADEGVVSLREVVAAVRLGLDRKPGLLPFPAAILAGTLKCMGRATMSDGLFADLVVDGSKVKAAFAWNPVKSTLKEMECSVRALADL
tara:strand:- start:1782 stop:2591 length:810 start_codon:yes stop_codon:yes gene_type:complete